ncbi:MAG: flagellar biosynthesis protein FliR [Herbaspirillum sp.]|jgi:flagellar biosynthetic protein FliR|nr:flagellar biosynthesis protein FliR [Herbaspirillum sp.]
MIHVTTAQLYAWIGAFIWPLTRILGLIAIAPPFGGGSVPSRIKLMLGILIAILIAPNIPAPPAIDPMSLPALLLLTQQVIIGASMGMAVRMVFAAVEMAGQIISMTMGLSFAVFFDPSSQGQTAAVSQLLSYLATLIFLAVNGHLVLISVLSDSFTTLPISAQPMTTESLHQLVIWCGTIFSMGLQLAMPVVGALLVTNLSLGILSRSAPQLNLFGIGFPITLSAGFILIAVTLPYMATPLNRVLNNGIEMVKLLGATPTVQPASPRLAPSP